MKFSGACIAATLQFCDTAALVRAVKNVRPVAWWVQAPAKRATARMEAAAARDMIVPVAHQHSVAMGGKYGVVLGSWWLQRQLQLA